MTITRFFVPAPLCMAMMVAAFGACGTPHRAMTTETTVQITGEFLADGSCKVTADGAPLYSDSEKPRTIYLRGRALNMAPAGFEMHEIWCAPPSGSEPMLPDQPNERAFFMNVYAPSGQLAVAQRYIIVRGMPTSSGRATALRANMSLFDPKYSAGTGASGPATTYLAGAVGDMTLTQVDSTRVVGTFKALGVRERTAM